MKLLTHLVVVLVVITFIPLSAPLVKNTSRDFSRRPVKQFGSRCTLTTQFISNTVHLSLFDIDRVLIGYNASVPTGQTLNFYSKLPYPVVIQLFSAMAPQFFWYAGKEFGGVGGSMCWFDGYRRFTCSQVFEC